MHTSVEFDLQPLLGPIARVFLKRFEGDEVKLPTPATSTHPAGVETLEILEVTYTNEQPLP